MVEGFNPVRYSVIEDKNPREIVMLVGDGCKGVSADFAIII